MSSSLNHAAASFSFFQAAPPKAGAAGTTDPGTGAAAPGAPAPSSSPGGGLLTFLPFLALIPFLFLSFRRQKKEREARGSLKKGDKVVTSSGLIGELMDLDDRIGKVKIAPGTTVQVLASALSPFEVTVATAEKKTDKDLEDLKEAKAGAASDKK